MDTEKIVSFVESSFLKELVENSKVTDISYNGDDIYYVDNDKGRVKYHMAVEHQVVKDFIRQIANLSEKQFSYQNPKLDVSFGRYRFNALHQSICRKRNKETVSFAMRLASSGGKVLYREAIAWVLRLSITSTIFSTSGSTSSTR